MAGRVLPDLIVEERPLDGHDVGAGVRRRFHFWRETHDGQPRRLEAEAIFTDQAQLHCSCHARECEHRQLAIARFRLPVAAAA